MKNQILFIGDARVERAAIELAKSMNVLVVTADEARNAFEKLPTFEIKEQPIFPDIFYHPSENRFNVEKHKATCIKNRKKRKKKLGRK